MTNQELLNKIEQAGIQVFQSVRQTETSQLMNLTDQDVNNQDLEDILSDSDNYTAWSTETNDSEPTYTVMQAVDNKIVTHDKLTLDEVTSLLKKLVK